MDSIISRERGVGSTSSNSSPRVLKVLRAKRLTNLVFKILKKCGFESLEECSPAFLKRWLGLRPQEEHRSRSLRPTRALKKTRARFTDVRDDSWLGCGNLPRFVAILGVLLGVLPCDAIVMMKFLIMHGTSGPSLTQILYLLRLERTSGMRLHSIPPHFE